MDPVQTKPLTLELILDQWRFYQERENISHSFVVCSTPQQEPYYREQEIKFRGMKESLEGLFFSVTGKFPKDYESVSIQEIKKNKRSIMAHKLNQRRVLS